MKKASLVLVAVVFAVTGVFAQTPEMFKYQAVLRDAGGQIIANENKTVVIDILQTSPSGNSVFTESHSVTTTAQGLINLNIGSLEDLSTVDFSADTYFIQITLDGTVMGTSQLLSVPYALQARKVEDVDYNELTNNPDLSVYATKDMANGNITNLADPVNSQDAATKAYVDVLAAQIEALTLRVEALEDGGGTTTVTDGDGNVYTTVVIDTQVWLVENLKTTKYNDGTDIPNVPDNTEWVNTATPAYAWYDNDEASYKEPYGALYNWYVVDTESNGGKNVCPVGWHVPTSDDWTALTDYLGGLSVAGGKMKEAGTVHWNSPNTGATNESGFTALPGGYRIYLNGNFEYNGERGGWWSATEGSAANAQKRNLINTGAEVFTGSSNKSQGYSIRCVKD